MEKSNKEKAKELYPTDFNYLGSGVINVPVKEREAFVKGAEWKKQEIIEKAVEWLKENTSCYASFDDDIISDTENKNNFINNFKQAMKGE